MNSLVMICGASLTLLVLLGAAGNAGAPASQPAKSPIAPGAKPIKVGDGYAFTEGATADKDGNVYFVDQPNNRIMLWTFDPAGDDPSKGKMTTFMQPSGYANGMCFDKNNQLIACADEKNELWSIDPATKKVTVLIKDHQGKPMNGPNDVWIRPDGGMYLTDPLYTRTWWTERPGGRGQQQPGRYVYYFSPDRKTLAPVITDLNQPNGIIGTPDGRTLYVSDINVGQTWKYTMKPDGTVADKTLFCRTGSDGMTIDDEGNIYTTHGRDGVQIWSPDGKRLEQLPLRSGNICFGGKNRDVLFINASTECYVLKMRTHGVGPS